MKCRSCCGHGRRKKEDLSIVECAMCSGTGVQLYQTDNPEKGGRPKMHPKEIKDKVKKAKESGMTYKDIEKEFNVPKSTAFQMVNERPYNYVK
jgi:hypothetical protein